MSTWRNCLASVYLVGEVNARWPNRDKASDGTIGDAAHASRHSDHNPWIIDGHGVGVVRARDIDKDLGRDHAGQGRGIDWLVEHLRQLGMAGDPRLANGGYLIWNARICGGSKGWAWRTYTGPNAHRSHLHVSFSRNQSGYDSKAGWGIVREAAKPQPPVARGGLFMHLTEKEEREILAAARAYNADWGTKGKGLRQVLAEIHKRTADLVTGKRPT